MSKIFFRAKAHVLKLTGIRLDRPPRPDTYRRRSGWHALDTSF